MRGYRKRGSDEKSGRGGLGGNSRNTPGGRGFSPEDLPRDGPVTPPPAIGGVDDPPPRNDVTPVHRSGDRIAVGASAVEGSGSDKGAWKPKFRLGSALSEKTPPKTHSQSRSGFNQWGARDPRRTERDWRARSPSSPSDRSSSERKSSLSGSSSGTPPWSTGGSGMHYDGKSSLSGGSSSGTPPYPTGGMYSDVKSRRKGSDDSPLSSPNPITVTGGMRIIVTGWPQRPVPELIIAMMTPGILGRAPTIVKPLESVAHAQSPTQHSSADKYGAAEKDIEDDATSAQPSTQSSTDVYDAGEREPDDDASKRYSDDYQYHAVEGAPEDILALWKDAVETLWHDAVVKFLEKYKHQDHQCEYYKAQLQMAKLLGKFDITVEFEHLKAWNKELASIICNGQGRDDLWLKQALHMFLNKDGKVVSSEDVNIFFRNMPQSWKRGRDIFCTSEDLVYEVKIFNRRETALTSSYCCAQIVDAIISEFLARLKSGVSWYWELSIEDIEFTEVNGVLKATITREPKIHQGATGEQKTYDFDSLWPMIGPAVTWRGMLPLYFEDLKDDLFGITAEEVTEPWFHDYISHHPSLIASMGRRNIEIGLYQTVTSWFLDNSPDLGSVFAEKPPMHDWRTSALKSPFLKLNFNHKNLEASDPRMKKSAVKDPLEATHYENTMGSLLAFRRHVHSHPNVWRDDIDECEIYLAKEFSSFLCQMLKELLKHCGMNGKFEAIWSAYKSSKLDARRLRTGSNISPF